MSTPTDSSPAGSPRRRETEIRIELAAVTAALDLGYDRVTIDEICTRADIARSTFFTYFNARDAAIVGRRLAILNQEAAAAVFDAHADNLPLGVFHLIFASVERAGDDPAVARARADLVASQPDARRAGTVILVDSGAQIMAAAREWLIAHPEHARIPDDPALEASLSSNAAYAGLSTLPGGWMAASCDLEASTRTFTEALDDLRVLLGVSPVTGA